MFNNALIVFALLLASAFLLALYVSPSKKLPPGPPSLPIIGNAHRLNNGTPFWKYLTSLGSKHGNVIYFSNPVLGLSILVLNSYDRIQDLLTQRASKYSDRLQSTMIEIMGVNALGPDSYGPEWRMRRKLFHQHMNKNAIREYWDTVEYEARYLVSRLHQKPDDFMEEIRLTVTRIILRITYDYRDIQSVHDTVVTSVENAVVHIVWALVPGRFLINAIPALRYVPSWMPGSGDRQLAEFWGKAGRQSLSAPFEYVKKQRAAGKASPSFALNLLEGQDTDDEELIMWLSASMYGGGAESTAISLMSFFLAMALFPEAQQKAQEEIDRVIGTDRLPSAADHDNLPYVDCLMKELMRWWVVAPLAIPHRLVEDDLYNGWSIPKGTIILPNTWAIAKNPDMYPEPDEFRPERFLTPGKDGEIPLDPRKYTFGHGRRACPGLDFADMSVFTTIVTVLATTTISKAIGEDGKPIIPSTEPVEPTGRTPKSFPCVIKSRSKAALDHIQEAVQSH